MDLAEESVEAVQARHKKEAKDLMATITGMKKQATKKTRKGVLVKCQELQDELERRHKQELDELNGDSGEQEVTPEELLARLAISADTPSVQAPNSTPELTSTEPPAPATPAGSGKKRNRAKERLEKRKAEIERIKQEATEEAANTTDYRQIEIESMDQLLQLNGLKVHEIKPDGHCLFASIQDQLTLRHNVNHSIQELRELSAKYISEHRDDFVPFMFDENTGELRDLDNYIQELTTTAMWGSDMEILALSKLFECPVSIFIAGASTIIINEGAENNELKLGYYKHSYGLGEHYNSLRDAS
ncbi:cysteine proteinase [Suhomyces tanzawaensis NRRL Y-17324]|uniref:Cysteine proteinase n=1 Tax=Suhomyces tanzawaensis NRRL Y-17324 TaxID=984487 RepID=A0A1E4SQ96_9ASCO|nr:cysteine proteinase [Suhomyces tanzawaensis NRRL Y-17324]ODV81607.1 cysteine proteinase [Suhomyces tanzawaensis NRRL Y-17324]